mmetsp:Transcript_29018/g.49590  ORF Transcript_29018/g.49590 Transcript_29018/m.49590 type:complete len:208 (+) Transcript_29018:36-659(+)
MSAGSSLVRSASGSATSRPLTRWIMWFTSHMHSHGHMDMDMAPCQLRYAGPGACPCAFERSVPRAESADVPCAPGAPRSPPRPSTRLPNVSISPPQTRLCARVWINVERFRLLSRHRSLPAAQCSALVAGIRDAVDSPLPPPTSASVVRARAPRAGCFRLVPSQLVRAERSDRATTTAPATTARTTWRKLAVLPGYRGVGVRRMSLP